MQAVDLKTEGSVDRTIRRQLQSWLGASFTVHCHDVVADRLDVTVYPQWSLKCSPTTVRHDGRWAIGVSRSSEQAASALVKERIADIEGRQVPKYEEMLLDALSSDGSKAVWQRSKALGQTQRTPRGSRLVLYAMAMAIPLVTAAMGPATLTAFTVPLQERKPVLAATGVAKLDPQTPTASARFASIVMDADASIAINAGSLGTGCRKGKSPATLAQGEATSLAASAGRPVISPTSCR